MESNVETARRGYEAALSGDLETVRGFLDPRVRWHGGDPDVPGACRGREQAMGFIAKASVGAGPGELVDVIGAGDRVVVIIRPIAAEGGPAAQVANLTTFRDGKAVEMVHYPDPADALAAIGRWLRAVGPGRP